MSIFQICRAFRSHDRDKWRVASVELIDLISRNVSVAELAEIADSIAHSGSIVDLSDSVYGDVPSTGGPASLSTLLSPVLLASCGVRVPKISATGSVAGSIDTLAMLPGFRESLSNEEFLALLESIGIAHIVPTEDFCPADSVLIDARRQRDQMANPALAAVSLLAKKVAVKGASALFDVRVGLTGNVGHSPEEARSAAQLFHDVARELNLEIGTALTDNDSFPSTALGRLESLDLLIQMLRGNPMDNELDSAHLDTCISLAAAALELATKADTADSQIAVKGALRSGVAYQLFLRHLRAQGASEAALDQAISERARQRVESFASEAAGYWRPPPLLKAKDWIKQNQQRGPLDIEHQIGYRLSASPGQWVEKGDVVAEVRIPTNRDLAPPSWLAGRVEEHPISANRGLLSLKLGQQEWRLITHS